MRTPTFDQGKIIDAALGIVTAKGMSALTARNVAAALNSSTIPVYLHFKGMESLRGAVRRRAYAILDDYVSGGDGGDPVLDAGVGIIKFAFEYPNLCRALFLDQDCDKELLKEFDVRLAGRIWETPLFEELSEAGMSELYQTFIIIVQGYMSLVCSGYLTDSSTETITKTLLSVCDPVIDHIKSKERRGRNPTGKPRCGSARLDPNLVSTKSMRDKEGANVED